MAARTMLGMSLALGALSGCGGSQPASQPATDAPATASTATTPTRMDPSATATTGAAPPTPRGTVRRGSVVYVSDGDTVGVRVDGAVVRVRLLGIDAPETKDPDAPIACWGPQASAVTRSLLPRGSTVTLVTDPSQDERDKFGRLLAYVFRSGEHEPTNETLVRRGAAKVYVYRRNRPFRRLARFRAAEAQARTARRGLWGACR